MFLVSTRAGYERNEQVASGWFLVMMWPAWLPYAGIDKQPNHCRAAVRYTKYSQFGNFMMGSCRIGGVSLTLSGTFGSDGLLKDVPVQAWNQGYPVPDDLYLRWMRDKAGGEGAWPEIREWAMKNLENLLPKSKAADADELRRLAKANAGSHR